MSSMKCISFHYLNFPEHLHIRHPEKIIIIKIWMVYFTISQVPVWNPFSLKSLHTLPTYNSHYSSTSHSNRMTYSMFHILFMYNTSLNQTRTKISTFLMSLHQAPLSSPLQRGHRALSLPRGPGTFPPSPGSLTPSGLMITSSTPDSIPWPHGNGMWTWHSPPVACIHPESWQMEHYYILNRPPTVS